MPLGSILLGADYHKGAFAYARGKDHWDEAKKAWEQLLQHPASERHYRSVCAAFMLGKLALKNNDADAVKWFQMVRDLAKEGYANSLGMAGDSYFRQAGVSKGSHHPLPGLSLGVAVGFQ